MKALTRFFFKSLVLCMTTGFAATLRAQAPSAPIDRYPTVTDPALKAALVRLGDLTAAKLDEPGVSRDAKLVLDRVAEGTLSLDGILPTICHIVEASAVAARPEHLPALVALARHGNKGVRDELASAQFHTTSHSKELLLQLVLTAESLLPGDLSDKQAAQERFDEFSSRVKTFCSYVPTGERALVREAVERFLARYDASIRQFYEHKFHKMLADQSLSEKHLPGPLRATPENAPAEALNYASKDGTAELHGTSPSARNESWLPWAVLVLAAVAGLLLAVRKASR